MTKALDAAADAVGVVLERPGENAPPVSDATKRAFVDLLGAPPPLPQPASTAAYVPPWLDDARAFGVALQLYQLRSDRNLGIGDLGDLKALVPMLADAGADFVGLNPLHALFTAEPERASPFSPSDRRRLNPFIIAVDEVPGFHPHMAEMVPVPSSRDQVDYTAAAQAKLTVLAKIHQSWRSGDPSVPAEARHAAARHASQAGAAMADFALFEALSHHMVASGKGAGWGSWPAQYADRASPEVRAFAEAHRDDVAFHVWLQHIAETQLGAAHAACRAAGMRIGLYLDLAVGEAPDGASTWADPSLALRGLRIGAPPDLFSLDGQDWGLAPLSPTALVERDFAPYRAVMDAVMADAGAMRIDHAMGLERLWLIPDGMTSAEGAYVRQPNLTDQVVAATVQHSAMAIGEDLGVVPPGFRERMAARRLFSMRILAFEHGPGGMTPPAQYPRDALACLSTHDIAPLEAWWQGDEIDLRLALGRIDRRVAEVEHAARLADKRAMLAMAGLPPTRATGPLDDAVCVAFHRLGARTASRLFAVRLEDVVGGRRLVNLPGTDREHPNWRRTLPVTVAEIGRSARLAATLAAVRGVRRGSG
ncbi:4-alpha-glucanotransferase [Acuticoccus sp. I52.16.1]|uniref:4-alpha-glucanotransferase n=1 Tax=Acuticoccus sp. I52.16.1 TaxID=2928472 RepID=UPI001FD21CC0|nr:4-alpha-glucanotransferase [Acuticoccus sp. I52.16.1]UOM36172.1 4-alpha-glucanotransferase [Acuticoccus sp. I52.16.1]